MIFYVALKRFFDVFAALLGIIIFLPVFLIIAALIKLTSRGPVFFLQERVGKNGKMFCTVKFRTMSEEASKSQNKVFTIGHDKRVTRLGSFLRRWKIDELPQLINVLGGKMSLVGPRPELLRYVNLYPPEQREQILSVQPGITSWASIEFSRERETLTKSPNPEYDYINKILPTKLSLDLEYLEKRSFLVDLLIIMRTVGKCCS